MTLTDAEYAAMSEKLTELDAKVAELERDKARLDWVDQCPIQFSAQALSDWTYGRTTLRQAIGTAMRDTKGVVKVGSES